MEKQKNSKNPDDIFSPETKKEKQFLRKSNKKRIIIYSVLIIMFLYGSIDYMNQSLVKIEIRSVTDRVIHNVTFIDGRCEVFIVNKSPFKIKLIIDDSIVSNYNSELLLPNTKYYFWFESNTTKTLEIGGTKG